MQRQSGLFIAIEGIEGAGKATQCELLRERLVTAGYSVLSLAFPRYDEPASYFIRQYLTGPTSNADTYNPYTASLFYALDHFQASKSIRSALAEGTIVIANCFTGFTLAHQGAVISHPEERRGYFIWLDNLEFLMLGTPRPDLNCVLRVTPDIASQHVDMKRLLLAPNHQAAHRQSIITDQQSVSDVFDDLCQLFPKDFSRIDCIRSGQLLTPSVIHSLIWGKVEPLLPDPPKSTVNTPDVMATVNIGTQVASVKTAVGNRTCEISIFEALQRFKTGGSPLQPLAASNHFTTPDSLDAETGRIYSQCMSELFSGYSNMCEQIAKHGGRELLASPDTAALGLLPLSTLQSDDESLPFANGRVTEVLRRQAESHTLPAENKIPNIGEYIKLIRATPRNEFDMVTPILFEASDLPIGTVESKVASWGYEQKAAVLRAYSAHADSSRLGFHNIRYEFDCLTDIGTMYGVASILPTVKINWHAISPALGYSIPLVINENDLQEAYSACFETSRNGYNRLLRQGYLKEAQYCVLLGHRIQWNMSCSLHDLAILVTAETTTMPRWICTAIRDTVSQAHPLLAAPLFKPNLKAAAMSPPYTQEAAGGSRPQSSADAAIVADGNMEF